MIAEPTDIHLYHLTLQRQTNYVHSCVGHFVDYKLHQLNLNDEPSKKRKNRRELQFCIATETHVELYDVEDGNLHRISSVPIFATITAMQRLPTENNYSYLVLVTDSGNLTITKFVYDAGNIKLHTLFNEPFGRSGVRRLSPQAYLDVDPHGRCIFLSALERNKLCYLTEFKNNELSISSPLEANRPNFITLDTTACDVAFDNPTFASLEEDIAEKSRHLIFYLLDLGLNHLVKKKEYTIPKDANFIMSVPNLERYGIQTKKIRKEDEADDELNPFVLVGFNGFISLRDSLGLFDIKVQLPSRNPKPAQTIVIAGKLHKLKKDFFILLQSNFGDLYKVKIVPKGENNYALLTITYFDTITPSEDLLIFKNGYLFSNSEFEDSCLFQFESLGNDDDFSKILTSEEPEKTLTMELDTELENLELVDQIGSANPSVSNEVIESTPLTMITQTSTSIKKTVTGVRFQELISTSLPPNSKGIWTVKLLSGYEDKLLFISLPKSTMVLKIEDGTMEELEKEHDSFKRENDETVFVGVMGERSIIQVCNNSMLQITAEGESLRFATELEWLPPAGIRITKATCTTSQLVLALSNREIVYFEIDTSTGKDTLNEYQDRVEMDEKITSITLPPKYRSDFLAIGTDDSSVKVLSLRKLDEESFLEVVSMQALVSSPYEMKLVDSGNKLVLHIGLVSGVYIRSRLDRQDGRLYDVRTKYLGTNPVGVSIVSRVDIRVNAGIPSDEDVEEEQDTGERLKDDFDSDESDKRVPCAILHGNRTWVSYDVGDLMLVRPLLLANSRAITVLAEFKTREVTSNGCCAISSSGSLVIGKLDNFTDTNNWFQQNRISQVKEDEDNDMDEFANSSADQESFLNRRIIPDLDDEKLFYIIQNSSTLNSCRISIFRSRKFFSVKSSDDIFSVIENCHCVDARVVKFGESNSYLVLSTTDMKLKTFLIEFKRSKGSGSFHLVFQHDTTVDDVVLSMIPFGDKLLVPVFGNLVLYGKGKKQLLKKSITVTPPSITKVTCLTQWENDRIALGDVSESVMLFLFDTRLNQFIRLADDVTKRYVVSLKFLDRSTLIGGDKFGNVWTLRLPQEHERLVTEEYAYFLSKYHNRTAFDLPPNIMECPFKLALTNHFYVNDIPINFHVLEGMLMSDRPAILYIGLQGTIGCLLPLVTKREIKLFSTIEKVLRDADDLFFLEAEGKQSKNEIDVVEGSNQQALAGIHGKPVNSRPTLEGAYSIVLRDHLAYRSYYAPVKNVIDGDLCETFLNLYPSEQHFLCEAMVGKNRDVSLIKKHINEMRINYV